MGDTIESPTITYDAARMDGAPRMSFQIAQTGADTLGQVGPSRDADRDI